MTLNDLAAVTYTVGQRVDLTFANSGVAADRCDVAPNLPTGLSVASSNGDCLISGTPFEVSNNLTYTVTAITLAGTTDTAEVDITVVAAPPPTVPILAGTYGGFSGTVGVVFSEFTITNTGTVVVDYTISPTLPAGLIFDRFTGSITGIPTEIVSPSVIYTITGTDANGGMGSVNVTIAIGPSSI